MNLNSRRRTSETITYAHIHILKGAYKYTFRVCASSFTVFADKVIVKVITDEVQWLFIEAEHALLRFSQALTRIFTIIGNDFHWRPKWTGDNFFLFSIAHTPPAMFSSKFHNKPICHRDSSMLLFQQNGRYGKCFTHFSVREHTLFHQARHNNFIGSDGSWYTFWVYRRQMIFQIE